MVKHHANSMKKKPIKIKYPKIIAKKIACFVETEQGNWHQVALNIYQGPVVLDTVLHLQGGVLKCFPEKVPLESTKYSERKGK